MTRVRECATEQRRLPVAPCCIRFRRSPSPRLHPCLQMILLGVDRSWWLICVGQKCFGNNRPAAAGCSVWRIPSILLFLFLLLVIVVSRSPPGELCGLQENCPAYIHSLGVDRAQLRSSVERTPITFLFAGGGKWSPPVAGICDTMFSFPPLTISFTCACSPWYTLIVPADPVTKHHLSLKKQKADLPILWWVYCCLKLTSSLFKECKIHLFYL